MYNLAPFRFRNVLAADGGPIARVVLADALVLGRREFMANAYLTPGLAEDLSNRAIYSAANGSGTSPSPMVARFMAISEALERWAHW